MKVDKDGNVTDEVELEIDAVIFDKHPFVDKDFGKYFGILSYLFISLHRLTV